MVDLKRLTLQQNSDLYDLYPASHTIRVPLSWEEWNVFILRFFWGYDGM
jgi:hypothetical protein